MSLLLSSHSPQHLKGPLASPKLQSSLPQEVFQVELTQEVLVRPTLGLPPGAPGPAAQMSASYVGRQAERVPHSAGGAGVLYILGGWGMGMRIGTASLKASRKACWRRWRLEMGLK